MTTQTLLQNQIIYPKMTQVTIFEFLKLLNSQKI